MALRLHVAVDRSTATIHAVRGFVLLTWAVAARAAHEPMSAALARALARLRAALRERRRPEPEPPIVCDGCVEQHGGKLKQPCRVTGCECYCNR